MDVKTAIKIAKAHVADIFSDEDIIHLGLEETDYDDGKDIWLITIGFARQWQRRTSGTVGLPTMLNPRPYEERTYKQVKISDKTQKVLSVKDRILREAA